MSEAIDLSFSSMLMCAALMLIPFSVAYFLKLGLNKKFLIATLRMSVQLVLIGIFLGYLFKLNNSLVNIAWFLLMLVVAVFSVINSTGLKLRLFIPPVLVALLIANLFVVIYFNLFIVRLNDVFEARYLIVVGGMVLGNSLRSDIIGLGDFYKMLKNEESLYHYKLSLGASMYEAILPFAKRSFVSALSPSIATMTTMGIVSLPGMMTGQMLGGSMPLVAIKYQIAIMVAILATTVLSVGLSLLFTVRTSFYKSGVLKKEIFK